MPERGAIRVIVAYAAPGMECIVVVALPADSAVADAIAASGVVERAGVDIDSLSFAIHGERADAHTPLRDGDRVELLRSLQADPKDVRRRRAQEKPLPRPRPKVRKRKSATSPCKL
jgi:putative ubiquitin-RnfH superfamily antitoxin RatB of RatAB toxin-antitoxin module